MDRYRPMGLWPLYRQELKWAFDRGEKRAYWLSLAFVPYSIIATLIVLGIGLLGIMDINRTLATWVLVIAFPGLALFIYLFFSLSVPVVALWGEGATLYRRRKSAWYEKPIAYHVPFDGRQSFWVWAGKDGIRAGGQACTETHAGGELEGVAHTKLDCMEPVAAAFLRGKGRDPRVFYQMLDPWDQRGLNEKIMRQKRLEKILSYTPFAILTGLIWTYVFLF